MAIGFVKEAIRREVKRGYDQPPRAGDVVEGRHVEGFEVFGRVEMIGFGSYMVRTDDGRLFDFRPPACTLHVLERCTAAPVTVGGWTYAAYAERPERAPVRPERIVSRRWRRR